MNTSHASRTIHDRADVPAAASVDRVNLTRVLRVEAMATVRPVMLARKLVRGAMTVATPARVRVVAVAVVAAAGVGAVRTADAVCILVPPAGAAARAVATGNGR